MHWRGVSCLRPYDVFGLRIERMHLQAGRLSGHARMILDVLEWYGAVSAVIAALVVASNISRRVSGWAFVLFVTSSCALVAWGFMSDDAEGIGWQNICLLLINLWGVYRYLIRTDNLEASQQEQAAVE